jgi:L-threonylcarbamoyladenylate synthase
MGKDVRFTVPLKGLSTESVNWTQHIRPVVRDTLCRGGIVILPTETSYMLGADAGNRKAMDRLRRLKNRPMLQNISIMFSSLEKARSWVCWTETAESIARRYLPGPLTMILPVKPGARQFASAGGSLGIRIPGNPYLLDLLADVDFPVTATSANPHGEAEPYCVEACVSPVDVVWDAGKLDPEPPSTILDLASDLPRILRQGAISIDPAFIEKQS